MNTVSIVRGIWQGSLAPPNFTTAEIATQLQTQQSDSKIWKSGTPPFIGGAQNCRSPTLSILYFETKAGVSESRGILFWESLSGVSILFGVYKGYP